MASLAPDRPALRAQALEESAMRRTLLAVAALLLLAGPAAAYTIFLKDGGRVEAREKYRVQGNMVIITLPSGATTQLPLSSIDVPRTERSNASNFGDARVIEGPQARPTAPPAAGGPRLGDVAQPGRIAPPPPRATPTPPPAVVPEGDRSGNRTPAGNVDLLRTQRTPLGRIDVATALGTLLRNRGIESAAFYEGTQPGRVLIEFTTNSEGAVFQALAGSALAMVDFEAQQPGEVPALEIFMATDRRQRAGQFTLTPERARELVNKEVDPTAFFLRYVEF
jgi:hypothetical protein